MGAKASKPGGPFCLGTTLWSTGNLGKAFGGRVLTSHIHVPMMRRDTIWVARLFLGVTQLFWWSERDTNRKTVAPLCGSKTRR